MRIANLHIENFRNLERIDIPFSRTPLIVLVGRNAIGKSTIINAIRLLFIAIGPRTSNELTTFGRNLGVLAPDNKDIDIDGLRGTQDTPMTIEATIDLSREEADNLQDSISNIAARHIIATERIESNVALQLFMGTKEGREKLEKTTTALDEYISTVKDQLSFRVALRLPFESPTDAKPELMSPYAPTILRHIIQSVANPQMSRVTVFPADRSIQQGWSSVNLAEGRFPQFLDSHLGNPNHKYQKIKDFLITQHLIDREQLARDISSIFQSLLTDKKFRGLVADQHGRVQARVEDHTGRHYDIDSMSSGEKNVVLSFFMALRTTAEHGICLFDEPELHLSPEACRKIVPFFLEKMAKERGIQTIICTHSPDILADAFDSDECSLFHIISSTQVEQVHRHTALALRALRSLGLTTDEFLFSRGAVFVEGSEDVRILQVGFAEIEEFRGMRFRSVGGVDNLRSEIRALQREESSGRLDGFYVFINDSDGREDHLPKSSKSIRIVTWARWDIESYLLDHNVLYEVARERNVEVSGPSDIESEIRRAKEDFIRYRATESTLQARLPTLVPKKDICSAREFRDAAQQASAELLEFQSRVAAMEELDTVAFAQACEREALRLHDAERRQPFSCVKGKAVFQVLLRKYQFNMNPTDLKCLLMRRMRDKATDTWTNMRTELVGGLPSQT